MNLKNMIKRFGELVLGLAVIGGALYFYYYWTDSQDIEAGKGRRGSEPLVVADTLKSEMVPVLLEAQGCA